MRDRVIIGSRGSALALTQTNWVAERIRGLHPGLAVEIEIIKTKGDKIVDVPLAKIGDKGLFVKELESALLSGEVDLAVHSMKDLPTEITTGLIIAAVPGREDPHDALILPQQGSQSPPLRASGGGLGWGEGHPESTNPLDVLPKGAKVGSSSLRRKSQLLHARPDLQIEDLRGNLDTRLRKLDQGDYDAIILASAGLTRLGWSDRISAKIPYEISLPAVGQGALALECRAGDAELLQLLAGLDDGTAHRAVLAERALMRALEGGCQVPIGAAGRIEDGKLILDGMVAGLDGTRLVRDRVEGAPDRAEALGSELAERLLAAGGKAILEQVRAEAGVSWSEPDGGNPRVGPQG